MTRLLEDMLTDDEISAINDVIESRSPRFDLLVKVSGLDPTTDFQFSDLRRLNLCSADLTGFNFTGSDLRQCIRNENTIIDETTIFDDSLVEWIEVDALPVVIKMQEVEVTTSSERRQRLLSELTTEFGRTTHVVTYMVAAAAEAKSLDQFLDFAQFLPPELSQPQLDKLRHAALKLLAKRLTQAKGRTRRDTSAIFAIDDIVARLGQTRGSLAASVYSNLSEVVIGKERSVMANVSRNDLERAFANIGVSGN